MGDVGHNFCPYLICDLPYDFEINGSGIAGSANNNELGLVLSGNIRHLGVVQHLRLQRDAVGHNLVHLS